MVAAKYPKRKNVWRPANPVPKTLQTALQIPRTALDHQDQQTPAAVQTTVIARVTAEVILGPGPALSLVVAVKHAGSPSSYRDMHLKSG